MLLAAIVVMALTRAEIVQRMRAPVVTQSDGMVKVYADCPEDMRREYQGPVAGFVADTVDTLYRSLAMKPLRFESPGLIVHVGDVRTNVSDVVSRVSTNGARVVTRIYLKSPGYADIGRLRVEVARAFYRSVKGQEISPAAASKALRRADPRLRISDERSRLESWLATGGFGDEDEKADVQKRDEEALALMRKILEPGVPSRRDVITFASRLFIYPRTFDEKFVGGSDCVSFRDAVKLARKDPRVRFLAFFKANELPVWGGGRGDGLRDAADAYVEFLRELAKFEKGEDELLRMLDEADERLKAVFSSVK